MTAPRHALFVLTRDFQEDATARYLLRRALGTCRRGNLVTVLLRGSAAERAVLGPSEQAPPAPLDRLLRAGARVAVDAQLNQSSNGVAFLTMDEDELTDLLLDPTVEALWC